MKDGEVEEDQGGCGLVLGLFYANALAPFPLASPRWPTFHQNQPCYGNLTKTDKRNDKNLRRIGYIRTSMVSFKCP